jgi:hypothetical protein
MPSTFRAKLEACSGKRGKSVHIRQLSGLRVKEYVGKTQQPKTNQA